MKKKKRFNRKVKLVILLVLILIVVLGFLLMKPKKEQTKPSKQEVKIEEHIEDYGYELAENETAYYKKLFQELKTVLNEDPIDETKYASLVSQLFLTDYFNLDNKISKNDVGGVQFVYSSYRPDFEKFAKQNIYHYVENNIYGKREQQLPIVKEVSVENTEQLKFLYLEEEDEEAYKVDLKIVYEEDMGYQTTATLYLVHHDNKLEIVKMTK